MGTAGDILSSPYFWILTGTCILCGWWAKRSLIDGIILGGIAPLILVPVWFVATIILPFLSFFAPELIESAFIFYKGLPEDTAILLFPSTFITAVLFLMFCRMERSLAGLPSGYQPRRPQSGDHNPFSRPIR